MRLFMEFVRICFKWTRFGLKLGIWAITLRNILAKSSHCSKIRFFCRVLWGVILFLDKLAAKLLDTPYLDCMGWNHMLNSFQICSVRLRSRDFAGQSRYLIPSVPRSSCMNAHASLGQVFQPIRLNPLLSALGYILTLTSKMTLMCKWVSQSRNRGWCIHLRLCHPRPSLSHQDNSNVQ